MKIFYHFTAMEYLESIRLFGLTKGDVPLSFTEGLNGVWLTTDPRPHGHGLTEGHVLTAVERKAHLLAFGEEPPEGSRYPNKMAARITISALPADGKLVRFKRWGPKNLASGFYDTLIRANGAGHASWFVFFGVIPPENFDAVEMQDGSNWVACGQNHQEIQGQLPVS